MASSEAKMRPSADGRATHTANDSCVVDDRAVDELSGTPSRIDDTKSNRAQDRFGPFVRDDVYGAKGEGPLGVIDKLKLFIAAFTLLPLRILGCLSVIVLYYFICLLFTLRSRPRSNSSGAKSEILDFESLRRKIIASSGQFCSRLVLFICGFYYIRERELSPNDICRAGVARGSSSLDEPTKFVESKEADCDWHTAIVSNHVSWIDILYYMSSHFPSFVAKESIVSIPLVGLISKCLGCIYVKREGTKVKGTSALVYDRLLTVKRDKNAQRMLLFPEGTTTNGRYLLPFKTGAFLGQSPVLPILLKYPHKRFNPSWETLHAKRHIFLLLCQLTNRLEVVRFPVYIPSEEERLDPRLYAENVRKLLAMEGHLKTSDSGLQDKRVYQASLLGEDLTPDLVQKLD